MTEHWTDRPSTECLSDWIFRLYDGLDWATFNVKVTEQLDAGLILPPTVTILWQLRQLEKLDTNWKPA